MNPTTGFDWRSLFRLKAGLLSVSFVYRSASAFSLAKRVHVLIQEVGIRYSCDGIERKPNVDSSLEPTGCFSVSWST